MCFLIDWMSQSAVALYIYRVGGLVPQEILLQDLNLWKSLVVLGLCLDRSNLPVKPVGSCRIGYIIKDRSDRLERPVRPVGLVCCQFWSSTYAPLFFDKACVPKNTLLDQNCLKAMINDTSAIFCAKGDKKISAMSCFPSSWWWINLLWSPNFLNDYWLCWLDLHFLPHRFLLA